MNLGRSQLIETGWKWIMLEWALEDKSARPDKPSRLFSSSSLPLSEWLILCCCSWSMVLCQLMPSFQSDSLTRIELSHKYNSMLIVRLYVNLGQWVWSMVHDRIKGSFHHNIAFWKQCLPLHSSPTPSSKQHLLPMLQEIKKQAFCLAIIMFWSFLINCVQLQETSRRN